MTKKDKRDDPDDREQTPPEPEPEQDPEPEQEPEADRGDPWENPCPVCGLKGCVRHV